MRKEVIISIILFALLTSCSKKAELITIGIISDAHGNQENINYFLDVFGRFNVDVIVFAGDLAEHFRKPVEGASDYQNIIDALTPALEMGVNVIAIPGNHDGKKDYNKAIQDLTDEYPNLVDMNFDRKFVYKGYSFVSIPGYDDKNFMVEDGFFITDEILRQADDLSKKGAVILLSHQPFKGKTTNALDYASIKKNVGSQKISELIKKNLIKLGIFGHIHEAGGKAITFNEKTIPEDSWSTELFINPGPNVPWTLNTGEKNNGMAGILFVNGDKAKYKLVRMI